MKAILDYGKSVRVPGRGRMDIVKMTIPPKVISIFNGTLIKYQWHCHRIRESNLNLGGNMRPWISKGFLSKKKNRD